MKASTGPHRGIVAAGQHVHLGLPEARGVHRLRVALQLPQQRLAIRVEDLRMRQFWLVYCVSPALFWEEAAAAQPQRWIPRAPRCT